MAAARARGVLLRASIWAIIGLIYTPFYLGLEAIFRSLGSASLAPIPAAAVAGGVGAAFYGARQMALVATLVGVASAAFLSQAFGIQATLWHLMVLVVATGLLVGFAVGSSMDAGGRCATHLWGKTLTGVVTGGCCAGVLVAVEPLHGRAFSTLGQLAFLVSVNGVLYVSTVRALADSLCGAPPVGRRLRRGLAVALIAAPVALGLWVSEAAFSGRPADLVTVAILSIADQVPSALLVGLSAGALTGALLELFRFDWVNEL
jgi:hypothetical protein